MWEGVKVFAPQWINKSSLSICRIYTGFHVNHLHQQTSETMTMYFTVIFPNTMMSFLYISKASAPIQNIVASVKYWINSDMMVQPISVSVRSSPTRTESSMKNMAILSCMCILLASRWRIFLNKSVTCHQVIIFVLIVMECRVAWKIWPSH